MPIDSQGEIHHSSKIARHTSLVLRRLIVLRSVHLSWDHAPRSSMGLASLAVPHAGLIVSRTVLLPVVRRAIHKAIFDL